MTKGECRRLGDKGECAGKSEDRWTAKNKVVIIVVGVKGRGAVGSGSDDEGRMYGTR